MMGDVHEVEANSPGNTSDKDLLTGQNTKRSKLKWLWLLLLLPLGVITYPVVAVACSFFVLPNLHVMSLVNILRRHLAFLNTCLATCGPKLSRVFLIPASVVAFVIFIPIAMMTQLCSLVWAPPVGLIVGVLAPFVIIDGMEKNKMSFSKWKTAVKSSTRKSLVNIKFLKRVENEETKKSVVMLNRATFFWLFTWPTALLPTCLAYLSTWLVMPSLCYIVAAVSILLLPIVLLGVGQFYDMGLRGIEDVVMESLQEQPEEEKEVEKEEEKEQEEEQEEDGGEGGGGPSEWEQFMGKYDEMLETMQNLQDCDDLPEEENNWVRLSFLLIDEGTPWVRKIIEDHAKNKHETTAEDLIARNKKGLTKYRKNRNSTPKLITDEQYVLLFPQPPQEASAETFDLTLLVVLISVLEVLPKPDGGWNAKNEPPPEQRDTASDLVRMRHMRNRLYGHIVKCSIPTDEFEREWEKLVEILTKLGADIQKIEEIKQKKMTTETRERCVKGITTMFTGDIPDMEAFAEDRMDQLAESHRERLAPDQKKGPQLCIRQPDGSWNPI